MPESLSQIYLHLVFSTKNRLPVVDDNLRLRLYEYMAAGFRELDCPAVVIGGMPDHVHILCRFGRQASVSGLLRDIKTATSKWLTEQDPRLKGASWQTGYGAFSISSSQVDTVTSYINNQPEHHRQMSFQQEYRAMLKKHQIEFDERYVWD